MARVPPFQSNERLTKHLAQAPLKGRELKISLDTRMVFLWLRTQHFLQGSTGDLWEAAGTFPVR